MGVGGYWQRTDLHSSDGGLLGLSRAEPTKTVIARVYGYRRRAWKRSTVSRDGESCF